MAMSMEMESLWLPGAKPLCYACEHELTGTTKTCYACEYGLTGTVRASAVDDVGIWGEDGGEDDEGYEDDAIWKCWCDVWECRCGTVKRTADLAWCPVCEDRFHGSRYLAEVFADDERTRWLANLVTHYRHNHRRWDQQHRWIDAHCRPGAYEEAKTKVNEQIKRALIRKHAGYMKTAGVTAEHFAALAETTTATLELAEQRLTSP